MLGVLAQHRRVRILGEAAVQNTLVADLESGLTRLSPTTEISADDGSASHIIVLLTGGTLDEGTPCAAEVARVVVQQERPVLYVYSTAHGWDFGAFYARPDGPVKAAIGSHEAQVFRPAEAGTADGGYEFEAMVLELLRKMRPAEQ